jgi:hypothetical protein
MCKRGSVLASTVRQGALSGEGPLTARSIIASMNYLMSMAGCLKRPTKVFIERSLDLKLSSVILSMSRGIKGDTVLLIIL